MKINIIRFLFSYCLFISSIVLISNIQLVSANQLEPIKVACTSLANGSDIISIAEKEDFFERNRIKLEKFYYQVSEKKAISLLISGQVDFVLGAAVEGMYADFSGVGVVFLASLSNCPDYKLVVSPLVKELRSLQDKRIGILVGGGKAELAARQILSAEERYAEGSVTWVLTGDDEARAVAVSSGWIDATPLPPKDALVVQQKGGAIFESCGVKFSSGVVQTTRKFLERNEEIVYRFLRAFVQSLNYFFEKKGESMLILQDLIKNTDKKLLNNLYNSLRSDRNKKPFLKPEGLKGVADYLKFLHPEIKDYDYMRIVNHSFLERVL